MSNGLPPIWLPAGMNSAGLAEDELNGGGLNPQIKPVLLESGSMYRLFVTASTEFSDVDMGVRAQLRTANVPFENRLGHVRDD